MAHPLRAFRLRLAALLHRNRQQSDYDEELAFHQHMLHEKLLRDGTPVEQADTDTRRAFGDPRRWRERLAELRQFSRLENVLRDLAFAARLLRKSPGFTLTAILTIALGIGANTAVFSLINGLLLRPLPVPHAEQLVVLNGTDDNSTNEIFSAPLFRRFEHDHSAFSHIFATAGTQVLVGSHGGKEPTNAVFVSGQFFPALAVPPLRGRYLNPTDDVPGGSPSGLAVVISENYWLHDLHSDPAAIGKKLDISHVSFSIVGIMPKSFIGSDPLNRPRLFLPLSSEPLLDAPYDRIAAGYHFWWLTVMGRLHDGVSLAQANGSLLSQSHAFLTSDEAAPDWLKRERPLHFRVTAQRGSAGFTFVSKLYRRPLKTVLCLCAALLLLACLNLASLLLARSAARELELATRAAIGASRWRLLQQLMIESFLLSTVGASIGLLSAPFTARALATLLLGVDTADIGLTALDSHVLFVAALASVLSALLIGAAPALDATRRTLGPLLKGARTSSLAHANLIPRILLSAQVALALMLVVGAGLVATSLVRIYRTGTGFEPRQLNLVNVSMTRQPLDSEALLRLYQNIRSQIAALPGIHGASILQTVPFSGANTTFTFDMPGGLHTPPLFTNNVASDYFGTMRIPILAGRDFSWSDIPSSGAKVILSRSAAASIFPKGGALGQKVGNKEVIGIVGDVKYTDIREPAPLEAYFPITQNDEKKPSYTFVARVEGNAAPFAAAVRAILARQAPDIPAPVFSTLSGTLDQSLSAERMMAMLSVFFAACALLVTAIGLYGTLAYRTARRTSEIGIRIALGAQRTQVVSLIFRQNVTVTVLGAAVGLGAALLAARALAGFLYGTSTHDPLVLSIASLLLALVAGVASLLPAIRAARIDPLTAIRTE